VNALSAMTLPRSVLVAVSTLGVAAILSATDVRAQVSIEASPLRIEMQSLPGASNTQAVTLTNVGKGPVRVRTSLSDWHLSRDGSPQFEEPSAGRPYAAASWVRFAPPEFLIEAGGQGTVRFTVTVPEGVEAAGYRTGLLFEFSPDEKDPVTRAKQVTVRSRIATLIYVHVAQQRPQGSTPGPGVHPQASVELVNLSVRPTQEETQVVATVKNTSRRSVRTKGTVILYDRTGTAVRELAVPDVPVLPESEREVVVPVAPVLPPGDRSAALPPGDYRVELRLDVGQPALIVGETPLKIGEPPVKNMRGER
jgi:P pilus assembly chaperone PapD